MQVERHGGQRGQARDNLRLGWDLLALGLRDHPIVDPEGRESQEAPSHLPELQPER